MSVRQYNRFASCASEAHGSVKLLNNNPLIDKFLYEGHWNDAYQFVSLHQPAAYYGVNSRELGEGGNDLVSKAQILAYYELVLKGLHSLKTSAIANPTT